MARGTRATAVDDNFQFVVSNGPKPPTDPALRTMIRRQAMRDAGVRRRRANKDGRPIAEEVSVACDGTNCSCNSTTCSTGSTPSLAIASASTVSTNLSDTNFSEDDLSQWSMALRSPSPVMRSLSPSTAYECARMVYGVDLSMLTILTDYYIGKSTLGLLTADPTRLRNILSSEAQYSYLPLVASRYDHSSILSAATDCLLQKVSSTLVPLPGSEALVLKLYAKALRKLQEAIMDPVSCTPFLTILSWLLLLIPELRLATNADVLCAIQMLSIHEVSSITGKLRILLTV